MRKRCPIFAEQLFNIKRLRCPIRAVKLFNQRRYIHSVFDVVRYSIIPKKRGSLFFIQKNIETLDIEVI